MKTRRKYKIIGGVMVTLLLVVACLMGASFYMLDYSLGYTQQDRKTAEAQRNRIRMPSIRLPVFGSSSTRRINPK